MMPEDIQTAPFTRRATAHLCDLALLTIVLTVIGLLLPVAPPPMDSMSFYSGQDFRNYFTLVAIGLSISMVLFLVLILGWAKSTPGMWLTGLAYSGLDGKPPSASSYRRRLIRGLFYTLLILLPGPVIALLVAFLSHAVFSVPFTTAADMLDKLGIPSMAQLAIHSLSFLALFVALIYVYKQLSHKSSDPKKPKASWFDRKSDSTIVLKKKL